MTDRFFTQRNCDRCHGPLDGGRTMSRFNTDCLCIKCAREEKSHHDYQKAADTELDAVRRGVRNFSGIGYPGKKP